MKSSEKIHLHEHAVEEGGRFSHADTSHRALFHSSGHLTVTVLPL